MMLDLGDHIYYITSTIYGPLPQEIYTPGFYYGTPDEQINGPFKTIKLAVEMFNKEMETW